MRQGQQNRRGRGNRHRKSHNPLSRSFESNGPDVKVRGTPAHIAEKYISLARDAQSSGDPVLAENYFQHAEHYSRIIMAYREQLQQAGGGEFANGHAQRAPGEGGDEYGDDDGDDGLDDNFQAPQLSQPSPPQQQGRQSGGGSYEGNNRQDRPFRRDRDRDHGRFRDRGERGDRGGDRGGDRHRSEGRQPTPERQPEPAAEGGGERGEQRRGDRFQQPHQQPDFLRRPVRRSRSENGESAPPKDETSQD